MNNQNITGGPAFPRPASEYTKNGTLPDGNDPIDPQSGMTLLDWFAGQTLAGFSANNSMDEESISNVALVAYNQAEAMINERNKRMNPKLSDEEVARINRMRDTPKL